MYSCFTVLGGWSFSFFFIAERSGVGRTKLSNFPLFFILCLSACCFISFTCGSRFRGEPKEVLTVRGKAPSGRFRKLREESRAGNPVCFFLITHKMRETHFLNSELWFKMFPSVN